MGHVRGVRKLLLFLETIKVSHSVFALPFAVASLFIACEGLPPLPLLGKVVLAVILARTGAMSFNRWADAGIDAENPRTRGRAVPAGLLSRGAVGAASLLAAAGFIAVAAWINPLAFALSPVVLAVLLGYSYTKRFTAFSHVVLGTALGLSPLGAWVAARGEVALEPAILGLAVLFWTAGFDVIYACQDHEFDIRRGLHSIPARLGIARALLVARVSHVLTLSLLLVLGRTSGFGAPYWAGVVCVALLLLYEHSIVSPGDLSRVNVAFFTLNGMVSLVFMAAVAMETVI